MRKRIPFNDGWSFSKEAPVNGRISGEAVSIPHTWNNADGQDGDGFYYRGTCWYEKQFSAPELPEGGRLYIEFQGVAITAEVYLNGYRVVRHEGGFSTFRADLTPYLREENLLLVSADNGVNQYVYPQNADFTFYGGIYRPVSLLVVPAAHFDLEYFGSCGVKVTPSVEGEDALVTAEAWAVDAEGKEVLFSTAGVSAKAAVHGGYACAQLKIENVHLWDGVEDPYLYEMKAELDGGDSVTVSFGCRSFFIDPEKGFFLNGRSYRLCGAARHQDRAGLGNALTAKEHEEDIALMLEMGANTVRLAHYQHSQCFYDLCDRYGIIAWAEIPYISHHMENANGNTVSQMTELVVQNYNHPSIVCWGLSNEITVATGPTEEITKNHQVLNALCHRLDATRPTTMAHAFMLDLNDPLVRLPDIASYNLYYGWYIGEMHQTEEWMDEFHRNYPDRVIGLSEFGADANIDYQSAKPVKGDVSETYQALYHEHMLKMWSERPYLWAMHLWNMFDFGADNRNEPGRPGQNLKGMVTFDRKVRKDAFFIYKAYLSKEKFVHLCGSRYVDRPEATTEIKVYSNLPEVELYVDGVLFATQSADKIFLFQVPITGEHEITAVSGACRDTIRIRKVDQPNPSYGKTTGIVRNWFDDEEGVEKEGYFSIMDRMVDIKDDPDAAKVYYEFEAQLMKKMSAAQKGNAGIHKVVMPPSMQRMIDEMTLASMLRQRGKSVSPEASRALNEALNRIPKK